MGFNDGHTKEQRTAEYFRDLEIMIAEPLQSYNAFSRYISLILIKPVIKLKIEFKEFKRE